MSIRTSHSKKAHERRDEARALVVDGIDPSVYRRSEKAAAANTFEMVARECLALQKKSLAATTYQKAEWTLEKLVFPSLGDRPIDTIKAADVLKVLKAD